MKKRYLITGTAGFIGFHLAELLLKEGNEVIGFDNFFPYYPVVLKEARHEILKQYEDFVEWRHDLSDLKAVDNCFEEYAPIVVCHLAAQAGVRYSMVNPHIYQKSNLEAFINILETCRKHRIEKFVYASSSSVYGNVKELPFHEGQTIDTPISLYAATKKANELIAHTYSHLYNLQTIGLRYFTVYGPWGRPDMAMWMFVDSIMNSRPITVYNQGNMERDFTYIDDIIAGTKAALEKEGLSPYEVINLGNNRSENIMTMIHILEQEIGKKANIEYLPIQPGDVEKTYANIEKAKKKLGYNPTTTIDVGIPKFIRWFQDNLDLINKIRESE